MSQDSEASSESEIPENQYGVILGFWDHEKTPTLIQDLERSVGVIEEKCKKLLNELTHYKKYLNDSKEHSCHVVGFKSKGDIPKFHSFGSEPDIVHRKNLIYSQKIHKRFEEKFQRKLFRINRELTEVAKKIGLKNIVLFPTEEYLKILNAHMEGETEKSFALNGFDGQYFSKSDTMMIETGGEVEFSKITKDELDLYQKLSRLNTKRKRKWKIRGKTASNGRKIRFGGGWKICSFRQDFLKWERKKPKSGRKTFRKRGKKAVVLTKGRSRSTMLSRLTVPMQGKSAGSEFGKKCQSLTESFGKERIRKSGKCEQEVEGCFTSELPVEAVASFSLCPPLLRGHAEASVPDAEHSTKRASTLRVCASENMCQEARERGDYSHGIALEKNVRAILRRPSDEKYELTDRGEDGHSRLGVNSWMPEPSISPNYRKAQSDHTASVPDVALRCLKSTLSQSTNEVKSPNKSLSKRAYVASPKILGWNCQRIDFCEVDNDILGKASGDGLPGGRCTEVNKEWTRAYSSFLSIHRKYTSLKKTLKDSEVAFGEPELKSLENEVDCSLDKYKKFLQFYSKFSHNLNHRLRPLKIACEAAKCGPVKSRKSWECNSAAMKKIFKGVKTLQEKIMLLND